MIKLSSRVEVMTLPEGSQCYIIPSKIYTILCQNISRDDQPVTTLRSDDGKTSLVHGTLSVTPIELGVKLSSSKTYGDLDIGEIYEVPEYGLTWGVVSRNDEFTKLELIKKTEDGTKPEKQIGETFTVPNGSEVGGEIISEETKLAYSLTDAAQMIRSNITELPEIRDRPWELSTYEDGMYTYSKSPLDGRPIVGVDVVLDNVSWRLSLFPEGPEGPEFSIDCHSEQVSEYLELWQIPEEMWPSELDEWTKLAESQPLCEVYPTWGDVPVGTVFTRRDDSEYLWEVISSDVLMVTTAVFRNGRTIDAISGRDPSDEIDDHLFIELGVKLAEDAYDQLIREYGILAPRETLRPGMLVSPLSVDERQNIYVVGGTEDNVYLHLVYRSGDVVSPLETPETHTLGRLPKSVYILRDSPETEIEIKLASS